MRSFGRAVKRGQGRWRAAGRVHAPESARATEYDRIIRQPGGAVDVSIGTADRDRGASADRHLFEDILRLETDPFAIPREERPHAVLCTPDRDGIDLIDRSQVQRAYCTGADNGR